MPRGGSTSVQRVLVVGATGEIGGRVATGLARQGHDVRALVRPGSDTAALEAASVERVRGDLRDPESLRSACRGVDTLVTTANAVARGPPDTVESVDRDGTLALIESAEEEGVDHLVYVSVAGASESSPVPLFRAKATCERRLRKSTLSHTILQPDMFTETWVGMLVLGPALQGLPVHLPGNQHVHHSFVCRDDVAAAVRACVGNPRARDASFLVGGPSRMSWGEAVTAVEAQLGRAIETRHIAKGSELPGLPGVGEMLAGEHETEIDLRPMVERLGVRPTPFEATVQAMVRGAR